MATILEEIGKMLGEADKRNREAEKEARKEPFTVEGLATPKFEVPTTRDSKQRDQLSKALTFVLEVARPLRKKDAITIMPIPTSSKKLGKIWTNVSRGKAFLDRIGLIRTFDNTYRPSGNERRGKPSFSKLYAYFYENEKKLVDYCECHGIKPFPIDQGGVEEVDEEIPRPLAFDKKRVTLGRFKRLTKPEGKSRREFEADLLEAFCDNYPEYRSYVRLVEELNRNYYSEPEMKPFALTFKPSFTWNRGGTMVTRIGIRATNPRCNDTKATRKDVLEEHGLGLAFDVNGSIPRINSSMNLGHWNDDPRDIYEVIFHECYPDEPFTASTRASIKGDLILRAYFEGTLEKMISDVWGQISHGPIKQNEVKEALALLDRSIRKITGPVIYGSDIFYFESCVYLEVLKCLLDDGGKAWLLYDGIYADGVMMDELFAGYVEATIKVCFKRFYDEYRRARGI